MVAFLDLDAVMKILSPEAGAGISKANAVVKVLIVYSVLKILTCWSSGGNS